MSMTAARPIAGRVVDQPTVRWLPSLSGLRFGAVLLVFGFHVYIADLFADGAVRTALSWLFGPGAGGVSLFFVLSGFVLTWSAQPTDTARQFWWRRFTRIYPTHATTALAAVVGLAVAGAGVTAATVVPNLLLVHVWIPDHRVFFGLNAVSWFVACEAFFYAVFPLLHRAVCRLPGRALWPGSLALFAVIWAIPLAAQPLPETARYWIIWILPLSRLPEFVVGILLARIVRERRAPWLRVPPLAAVAVVAYFGSPLLPLDFRHVAATAAPLALLVAALGAADLARAERAESAVDGGTTGLGATGTPRDTDTPWPYRMMALLGEYAFAFFMVHQLVLRTVIELAGPIDTVAASVTVLSTALLLALLASWLLHHLVGVPAIRLLGRARPQAG
jgi:peptidoglycan/LPS O-acetylase OafA/YrhL